MESRTYSVALSKNPSITIKVIPGHFATTNSHINNYFDMSELKTNAMVAKEVAKELAMRYLTSTLVDTIVCMDGTGMIGGYMAEELLEDGSKNMNRGGEIHVVTPTININKKFIFPSNVQKMIADKSIVLLVASASSGKTIDRALECIAYYGGTLAGISALFSALPKKSQPEIHTLFTVHDIAGYETYSPNECALCKNGHKLDAIVNSEGYIKYNT